MLISGDTYSCILYILMNNNYLLLRMCIKDKNLWTFQIQNITRSNVNYSAKQLNPVCILCTVHNGYSDNGYSDILDIVIILPL